MAKTVAGRNVDFIILAEFDILTGSSIRCQYPQLTSIDEGILSELMLPDGCHKRKDDWTVFFLNRPGADKLKLRDSVPGDSTKKKKGKPEQASATTSSTSPTPTTEPTSPQQPKVVEGFVYRFQQEAAHLGWRMITQTPQRLKIQLSVPVRIFTAADPTTPLLEIARNPLLHVEMLEECFIGLHDSSTTALGFRFDKDRKDVVKELVSHFTTMASPEPVIGQAFLYCLNRVTTLLDDSVKRGAKVKALAICSTHHYIDVFRPFIVLTLDRFFACNDVGIIAELFDALNAIDLSQMPKLTDHQRLTLRHTQSTNTQATKKFATSIMMPIAANLTKKMPVYIPLTQFPDEVGDYQLTTLFRKFGRQTMTIFNALLLEKRIVFLGFNAGNKDASAAAADACTAGDVCAYVLAALCMVCPPLKGLASRAFPYTNLCFLDFLNVPGYVAGVTNPMFEEHPEWCAFSVRCDRRHLIFFLQVGRTVQHTDGQSHGEPQVNRL
eukprot:TRINITY_DN3257_c0_g1_i1.p1 TRINITY_DN3257_c0_g1~~TRINITY_DN3257_c0_g1_i1.p1  ORF type:complete len:506 (-),score=90.21 TRINITY_DN3257_c0_g1_i1:713-2197(-)